MDISQLSSAGAMNAGSLDTLGSESIDLTQFLGSQTSALGGFDINSILGDFDMTGMLEGFDINSILSGFDMGNILGDFDINSILSGASVINAESVGGNDQKLPVLAAAPQTQSSPTTTPSSTTTPNSVVGSSEFSNTKPEGKGSESSKKTAVEVRDRLMQDYGLTKEQASGIVGNLYHESDGMKPDVNEYSGGGGFGWAQWTGSRRAEMENWCKSNGYDPSSTEGNYQFLKHEMDTVETGTIPAVKNAGSASEAALAFEGTFERATSPVMDERIKWANEIANM